MQITFPVTSGCRLQALKTLNDLSREGRAVVQGLGIACSSVFLPNIILIEGR